MKTHRLASIVALGLSALACSSSSSPPPPAGAAPDAGHAAGSSSGSTPSATAKVTLDVPASFAGTPRKLDVALFSSLPIAGPPAAVLYESASPAITAGQALAIDGDATAVSGDYFVVAVLYMQGGGEFSPKAGVDYDSYGAQKVHFAGAAIDLGAMRLALDGADAGP